MLTRRDFHHLSLVTLASVLGCRSSADYTAEDMAGLEKQKRDEAAQSGRGPFGPLRFDGYRGLAKLPYFKMGDDGFLHTIIDLPEVIDFHAHLGWSYLFAPRVDLRRRTERVQYLMDCDAETPPCPLDLDVYVNANFSESMHEQLENETVRSLTFGSSAAATHTAPNLVAEMKAAKVTRAAILPIVPGLPFSGDPTLQVLDVIAALGLSQQLIPFASVHPRSSGKLEQLRRYKQRGVRGVKLHPEMQRFFPDERGALEVYEECGKLGLPIIFHAGRSGIEPEFMRPYAVIRRYDRGMADFPNVQFILGHAGARDVADAIPIAQKNDNVWLELSSQGVTKIHELLQQVGSSKLLYGTDWPFYPLAVALAKILLVTEGNPAARTAILGGNAKHILGDTTALAS